MGTGGYCGNELSGQMHGLVLLDEKNNVLRNAILWNDTRTTAQCEEIYQTVGKKRLLQITKNPALEGFTLPEAVMGEGKRNGNLRAGANIAAAKGLFTVPDYW